MLIITCRSGPSVTMRTCWLAYWTVRIEPLRLFFDGLHEDVNDVEISAIPLVHFGPVLAHLLPIASP